MVLTCEGDVWAAGWNRYGQLGNGTSSSLTAFTRVMINEAEAVAAGDRHSVVLQQDGSVWATGRNYNGQLGDGSKVDRSSFVKVISTGAVDVAAGGCHSMVLATRLHRMQAAAAAGGDDAARAAAAAPPPPAPPRGALEALLARLDDLGHNLDRFVRERRRALARLPPYRRSVWPPGTLLTKVVLLGAVPCLRAVRPRFRSTHWRDQERRSLAPGTTWRTTTPMQKARLYCSHLAIVPTRLPVTIGCRG